MINKYIFPFLAAHQANKKLQSNLNFHNTDELNSKWECLLRGECGIYDAVLLKIKNKNNETTFDQINEYWRTELSRESISNDIIHKIQNKINQTTVVGIESKWRNLLQNQTSENAVETVTNNMYTDHSTGLANAEHKASSLLIAVGFSISLMSIFAGLIWNSTISIPSIIFYPFLGFSSLSIINMIFTAFSAWYGIKVSTRYYSTVGDFERVVTNQNWQIEWAVKQLTNLELNNSRWTIKTHWVDVGQIHFIYGIILIAFGFFTLLIGYVIINLMIN